MVDAVAVVALALRLPGASSLSQLWRLLADGVEGISDLDEATLRASGVPEAWLENPAYVRRKAVLEGIELFDAARYRMSPREAQLTAPEQRLLLECADEALAAVNLKTPPPAARGGVFVAVEMSRYLLQCLVPAQRGDLTWQAVDQAIFGNDKDHAALRLAHRFDLTGPAQVVGASCASSLVAIHLACQSLLLHECDYVVAGGASVEVPHRVGYLAPAHGLLSATGHCSPFGADAAGTVPGSGAAVVVLMRLADALAGSYPVLARVLGSATGNDGARRQSYTAPSMEGQVRVVGEALAVGGLSPGELGAIEAQGLATPAGDAVEVAALRRVWQQETRPCALGSIKGNLGHLGSAAGIAGLAKAILMVRTGRYFPTRHGETANPGIAFGPFFLPRVESAWDANERMVGVSAFGLGGSNAHVVVASHGDAEPLPAFVPAQTEKRRHWIEPAWSVSAVRGTPETLSDLIAGVLGTDALTPETDLGAAGLDSFLAAEVALLVRERFGVELTPALLSAHRTVGALAAAIAQLPAATTPQLPYRFAWVDTEPDLLAVHRWLLQLPIAELGVLEPMLEQATPITFSRFAERWARGECVVLTAAAADGNLVGTYLFARREGVRLITDAGVSDSRTLMLTYSYLAPEHRGWLSGARFERWFSDAASVRPSAMLDDIASTLRFRPSIYEQYARLAAAALARSEREQRQLFEHLYYWNFDPAAELEALIARQHPVGRLLAALRAHNFDGVSGAELLRLPKGDPRAIFDALLPLIPEDALPRLRDTCTRLVRGESRFVGYELRWLEPVFIWSARPSFSTPSDRR